MGKIAGLGVAPFIMQSTESLVTVVLNTGMQTYGGDLYVGSITIIQSIMQMIVMPTQGITQGVQPIMSYNYGAKNYRRVRQTFKRLLAVTMTVTCSAFVMVALIPGVLARIFTPEQELIQLVSRVMPLFFGGIWAFGAQMACQSTFMALGQARTSLVPGPAAEGDPAGAPGPHPAQSHRQRHGDLCGRAHRRHPGQCHHPDFVPLSAEKAAAHREGRSEGLRGETGRCGRRPHGPGHDNLTDRPEGSGEKIVKKSSIPKGGGPL